MFRFGSPLALALLAAAIGVAPASVAFAQEQIGRAATVRNDVSQVEPRLMRISAGDDIFRNELVRTAADSDARFVFRDDTNLSLGPGSTLRLDRAVYSGESSYRDIAVRLSSGAFRFVTGHSAKEAYTIRTPLATIGVRGTVLDFLVQRSRNIVVLQEGQAQVCTLGSSRTRPNCAQLLQPGDSVIITPFGGGIRMLKTGSPGWSFASACSGNSSLCGVTTFADAGSPGDVAAALCGK